MEIENNQLVLFGEFVQEKLKKEPEAENCLNEQLEKLISERRVTVAHIHKATGISYSTLHDMMNRKHRYQKLNRNILELARFFNVSIEFLVYGIGEEDGKNV